MSGLRVHHPTRRNEILAVPHPGGDGREAKVYKIRLDARGDAIISDTVWARLEEARRFGWPHELVIANVVGTPPRQQLNLRRNRQVGRPLPEHRIVRT